MGQLTEKSFFDRLLTNSRVILIAVIISILLSIWHIYIAGVVNRDGAQYLLAAAGDWSQAESFIRWPFYPLLLQWLSGLFQVEAEQTAYALNILFDAITLFFFLRIIRLFGGGRLTLVWAAVAFLALSYFNDNRAEIIRDHGYWMAFMAAVWYYIRLYRVFSWGRAIGWTVAMLIATLFRIEGIAFLVLAPVGLLLNTGISWRSRYLALLKTWLPLLILAIMVLVSLATLGLLDERIQKVVYYAEYLQLMVTKIIPQKALLLQSEAFIFFSKEEVHQGFYVILGWGILRDFIEALTPFFFLVLVFRIWFPVSGLSSDSARIVWTFVLINLVVLMFWVTVYQIMVARYTMIMALLALIWVSFALAGLHQCYRSSMKGEPVRIKFAAVVLAVIILLVDGIVETPSKKAYIVDAGEWIQDNLPKNSKIATNYEHERLRYYANKGLPAQPVFELESAAATDPARVEYLLLRLRKNELVELGELSSLEKGMQRIHEIKDGSGNGYAVYSRQVGRVKEISK